MFDIDRNYLFYLLIFFLSSFFLITNILLRFFYNLFTRILYAISATWIGVLFLLLFTLIIYEPFLFFSVFPKLFGGRVIISAVLILTFYSLINARKIHVKSVEIPFPKRLRAVLLTDLHIGTIHNEDFLKVVVEKTNSLKPEVVFITGDIISGSSVLRKNMFDALRDIKCKAYFVPGNHEFYEGIEYFLKFFSDTDIQVLRNEIVDFQGISILGLDYPNSAANLKNLFEKIEKDNEKPLIVLQHEPRPIGSSRINLILSGHTHGGQVIPFNWVIRLFIPFVKGLYKLDYGFLYVSAGTGTWGPPMRLGSRNEITLLNLK